MTKISYDADHVTVHTDRKRYQARFAVVTFSLGVLQQQAVEFHPALPSWKTLALHGVSPPTLLHLVQYCTCRVLLFWLNLTRAYSV